MVQAMVQNQFNQLPRNGLFHHPVPCTSPDSMPGEDITFVMTGGFAVCPKKNHLFFLSSQELLSKLDHAKRRGYLKNSMLISFEIQVNMLPLSSWTSGEALWTHKYSPNKHQIFEDTKHLHLHQENTL